MVTTTAYSPITTAVTASFLIKWQGVCVVKIIKQKSAESLQTLFISPSITFPAEQKFEQKLIIKYC